MGILKKRVLWALVASILLFIGIILTLVFDSQISKDSKVFNAINYTIKMRNLELPLAVLILLIIWIIIILSIFTTFGFHKKQIKEEKIKVNYEEIKRTHGKSTTDFDALYEILKKNKKTNIKTISKIFNVQPEKALEWARILENNNLVVIEYPAFSDPEVEIKEEVRGDEYEKL